MDLPATNVPTIHRGRLVALLESGPAVTLVTGRSGTGKSVAVAQYASTLESVVWLSLTAVEADAVKFSDALTAAMVTAGMDCASIPPAVGHLERVLHLFRAVEAAGALLVLDDVHTIPDSNALALLEAALQSLPRGLRLILISRTEPALGLHRLEAAGLLQLLDAATLAFTASEAAELLAGFDLGPDAVRALVRTTGGWAAGLQFAAMAVTDAPDPQALVAGFPAHDQRVARFVRNDLRHLSAPARQVLTRTSHLESFSVELAAHLVPLAGLEQELSCLTDAGYLLATGDEFRPHPSIQPALQAVTRENPGELAAQERLTAQWFGRNERHVEAVCHALRGGDGQLVAAASAQAARSGTGPTGSEEANAHIALAAIMLGELVDARQWVAGNGTGTADNSRTTWIARAILAMLGGDHAEFKYLLNYAETATAGLVPPISLHALRSMNFRERGETHAAQKAFNRFDPAAIPPADPWSVMMHTVAGVELHYALGTAEPIPALAESVKCPTALCEPLIALGRARVMLALRREEEARDELALPLSLDNAWGAAAWYVLSQVEDLGRRDVRSTEAMARALRLAEAQGYFLLFQHLSERQVRLLRRHHELIGTHSEFVAALLPKAAAAATPPTLLHPLTERELAVLAFLPTLSSNEEIAGALNISVNTVKQHLKSVNRKLQVNTRRDAVRMARRLRLLPDQALIA